MSEGGGAVGARFCRLGPGEILAGWPIVEGSGSRLGGLNASNCLLGVGVRLTTGASEYGSVPINTGRVKMTGSPENIYKNLVF